ncbi:unnamed protein product [Didymodactylos carnosus]|uniref:Uncharacterized protein n=1 Tax=Didymodactylos carnosus TaxID=1234261 RepID=A0A813VS29_9BILA|nr:unnamed protein product [Didymodactylos carnosus]CAF3628800.1 unnamed protein product [Didymodactylos carnosus]
MSDSYDDLRVDRRDPITLTKTYKKDVKNVKAGASRQHFLTFDDTTQNEDENRRQLTAYTWPAAIINFDKALKGIEQHDYEESLVHINKCLLLIPYHSQFYEMRAQLYLELCDFQSALLTLQKIILSYQVVTKDQEQSPSSKPIVNKEEKILNEKISFLRYIYILFCFNHTF